MTALEIVEFRDDLAPTFHDINAEWIEAMFAMEPHDHDVLSHPRENIVDRGGSVLFVDANGLGIVGTGALMPDGRGGCELTKMGVRATARGRKVGEFLLAALIDHAAAMPVTELYLLTNARCEAAVHLYEKLGFMHDADIMARYGANYDRCNVAMSYDLLRYRAAQR